MTITDTKHNRRSSESLNTSIYITIKLQSEPRRELRVFSTTISGVIIFDVTEQSSCGSSSVVAMRALEGLHAVVFVHVVLQVPLLIGAEVAQRTLETTRTR